MCDGGAPWGGKGVSKAVANAGGDPTGFETLKKVLGGSMSDRENEFTQFVMKLEFP